MEMISSNSEIFQWIGAITGIAGSLLLALKIRISHFAWICYLISNFFWIIFSIQIEANGLLTMQIFYTIISLIGLWKWVIKKGDMNNGFIEEEKPV